MTIFYFLFSASAGFTPETSDAFVTEENTLFSEGNSDLCDLSPLEPDEDLTDIIQYIDHPASSWDSMFDSDRKEYCDSSYGIEECSIIKSGGLGILVTICIYVLLHFVSAPTEYAHTHIYYMTIFSPLTRIAIN